MQKLTAADIHTPAWSLDDLPTFKARLSKDKADRIRFHQIDPDRAWGNRTRWINNPVKGYLENHAPHGGGPVDDIIAGIANLDHDGKSRLNATRIHTLLQLAPRISSALIEEVMGLDGKQARRYMAACKLCIPFLLRHFESSGTLDSELHLPLLKDPT